MRRSFLAMLLSAVAFRWASPSTGSDLHRHLAVRAVVDYALGIVASRFVHTIDCGGDIAPCANELFCNFAGHLLIPGHLFTARAGDAQRNATADSSIFQKGICAGPKIAKIAKPTGS